MAPTRSAVLAVAGVVVVVAIIAGLVASPSSKLDGSLALSASGPASNPPGAPVLESSKPLTGLPNGAPASNAQAQTAPSTNLTAALPLQSQIGSEWSVKAIVAPLHAFNSSDYSNSGTLMGFNAADPHVTSVVEGVYDRPAQSGNTSVAVFLASYSSAKNPIDEYSNRTQYSIEKYQKFDTTSVPNSVCLGAFFGNLAPGQMSEVFCYKGTVFFQVTADSNSNQDTRGAALAFAESIAANLDSAVPSASSVKVPVT